MCVQFTVLSSRDSLEPGSYKKKHSEAATTTTKRLLSSPTQSILFLPRSIQSFLCVLITLPHSYEQTSFRSTQFSVFVAAQRNSFFFFCKLPQTTTDPHASIQYEVRQDHRCRPRTGLSRLWPHGDEGPSSFQVQVQHQGR